MSVNTSAICIRSTPLFVITAACSDDGASVADVGTGSDTAAEHRFLHIPDNYELCAVTGRGVGVDPEHGLPFAQRSFLRFEAGTHPVPGVPDIEFDTWIPFEV